MMKASKLGRWENAKFLWNTDFFQAQLKVLKKHTEDMSQLNQHILQLNQHMLEDLVTRGFAELAHHRPKTYAEAAKKPKPAQGGVQGASGDKSRPSQKEDKKPSTPSARKTKDQLSKSLLTVVSNGRSGDITALLMQGAEIDASLNMSGDRALHIAALNGDLESVRILIKKGADVNTTNKQVNTPVYYSLHSKAGKVDLPTLRALLGAGAKIGRVDDSPLALGAAFEGRDIDLFCLLLERGADPTIRENSSHKKRHWLHLAALDASPFGLKIVEIMSKQSSEGIDSVDEDGETPLNLAVRKEYTPAVTLLLQHGADPMTTNTEGISARYRAAWMGNLRILQLLYGKVEHRTAVKMFNPFTAAISNTQFEIAAFLLGLGFDINDYPTDRMPVLHYAAYYNNLVGVKWLVRQGADRTMHATSTGTRGVKIKGPLGTAEDLAKTRGHTEVAEVLASYSD